MQAAIGAILWATAVRFKAKDARFKTTTLTALILSIVGMGASLFHLGRPWLALTSMFNIATSWLSREIFFSGAFFVLLLVFWWLERADKSPSAQKALLYLTGLAGIIAVFAMGKLYMASIMPAWQSVNTLITFYATTIVLGGILLYLTAGKERDNLPRMDLVILAVVLIQAAFAPGHVAALSATSAGMKSALLLSGQGALLALSWLFTLGGVFMLVLSHHGKLANRTSFLYLAVAVLVIGEICSRYLFYASGVPIGFGL